MKTNFTTAIAILLIFSCNKRIDDVPLSKYSDPYLESFWGKSFKFMLIDEEFPNRVDTIVFDKRGDIVYRNEYRFHENRSYDSLHFLKRILSISDVSSNYLITYHLNGKRLQQEWKEIKGQDWSESDSKFGETEKIVEFDLDGLGRITKETDTSLGEYVLFEYDDEGLLMSKKGYTLKEDSLRYRVLYTYDDSMRISQISSYATVHLLWTHYFSRGVLDSTIYQELNDSLHYRDKVKRYRYVFY